MPKWAKAFCKSVLFVSLWINLSGTLHASLDQNVRDGDIIFQDSQSSQSQAIQRATKSNYSHVGIIFVINRKPYVFEAVQPVKYTALLQWIQRGKSGRYVVKRLHGGDKILTKDVLEKMRGWARAFEGKDYDLGFGWSDEKVYCSELVWKLYDRAANLQLGKLQRLKDFDLTDPTVKAKLKERYGSRVPLEEPVISPAAIYSSNALETVTFER